MEKIYLTNSEAETREVARRLAEGITCGATVCLRGDLGVGKTVFAKGFCAALGVTEHVSSPTFTLVNEYELENRVLYHFDLYRIEDADELYEIGFSDFVNGESISLIEWPERAEELLPAKRMEVSIVRTEEDGRRITIAELM